MTSLTSKCSSTWPTSWRRAGRLSPGRSYSLNDHHTELEIEEALWLDFEKRIQEKINGLTAEAREQLRKNTEEELRTFGYNAALSPRSGPG